VEVYEGNGASEDAAAGVWVGVAVGALVPLAVVLARLARNDRDPERPAGTEVEPAHA
jgi:hypothetical protein